MKNRLIYLLLPVILAGCGIKLPVRTDNIPLATGNTSHLNGYYNNIPTENAAPPSPNYYAIYSSTIERVLVKMRDTTSGWRNHIIQLEAISTKKLRITVWNDKKVVKMREVRGKISNGMFVINRRKYIGIPILFFISERQKIQLGIDPERHLLMDSKEMHYGNVLFFMGGGESSNSSSYQRN